MDAADKNDSSRRRSSRLAARLEDKPNQLVKELLKDLDQESTGQKSSRIYKSMPFPKIKKKKRRPGASKTLFDRGVKAQKILGATYVDDETNDPTKLCYLVKFENGQFELVSNKLAHRFCPTQVIDFLESNVSFRDEEVLNRMPETMNPTNQPNLM